MIDVILREALNTALGVQTMDTVVSLAKRRQVQIIDNRTVKKSADEIFLNDQTLIDELQQLKDLTIVIKHLQENNDENTLPIYGELTVPEVLL